MREPARTSAGRASSSTTIQLSKSSAATRPFRISLLRTRRVLGGCGRNRTSMARRRPGYSRLSPPRCSTHPRAYFSECGWRGSNPRLDRWQRPVVPLHYSRSITFLLRAVDRNRPGSLSLTGRALFQLSYDGVAGCQRVERCCREFWRLPDAPASAPRIFPTSQEAPQAPKREKPASLLGSRPSGGGVSSPTSRLTPKGRSGSARAWYPGARSYRARTRRTNSLSSRMMSSMRLVRALWVSSAT